MQRQMIAKISRGETSGKTASKQPPRRYHRNLSV